MQKKFIVLFRWFLILFTMLVVGTISLVIVLISFGYLRNFIVKYIFSNTSRFILITLGYSFEIPDLINFPKYQVMYTINHNSYLDIFILTMLGLPNLRYIISEVTFKFVPLIISAKAIGTKIIPQKKHAKRRLKFFIRITSFLKKTNYSVIASPEGVRGYTHGIFPFNKGVFHMAMEAKIPIVPLFIYIPEKVNPYKGSYSEPGKIKLFILDEIDNSSWKLETIWEEIAKVRQVYVDKFNELNNTNIT